MESALAPAVAKMRRREKEKQEEEEQEEEEEEEEEEEVKKLIVITMVIPQPCVITYQRIWTYINLYELGEMYLNA
mgnify:CR=1 FL=1